MGTPILETFPKMPPAELAAAIAREGSDALKALAAVNLSINERIHRDEDVAKRHIAWHARTNPGARAVKIPRFVPFRETDDGDRLRIRLRLAAEEVGAATGRLSAARQYLLDETKAEASVGAHCDICHSDVSLDDLKSPECPVCDNVHLVPDPPDDNHFYVLRNAVAKAHQDLRLASDAYAEAKKAYHAANADRYLWLVGG